MNIPSKSLNVPFNDLSVQWEAIAKAARPDIDAVFRSGRFCLGPEVDAFEREAEAYLGAPYAVGVNSGTSALHLAVLASDIGPGDEVLVPAHTFIATLWAVIYTGAKPILCDVDARTGTIDVADAEERLTRTTRAIIPVHIYGQPADMGAVTSFAARNRLIVIEDAAQSIGAHWEGRPAGSIGRFGCFSFYPGKNLGAAGEAGLVVAQDEPSAERLRSLRNHGQAARYVHAEIGFNYRMDALQAVVLRHKLRLLDGWTSRRKELAAAYTDQLAGVPITLPTVEHHDHVWHLYVVRTQQRDALRQHLSAAEIETGLHYPVPNHRQPCLADIIKGQSHFPQSERWASEGISLPLFYGMSDAQVAYVSQVIRAFFGH